MSRNRLLTILLVLVLVIAVAGGSWILGSTVQSPEEAAARTAPPQPSPILVPVQVRTLSANVVTRGTARYGLPQSIAIAPSALKADASVITSLPERGMIFDEGDILFNASGRPVFILQGEIPAYRDLGPGAMGADVRQLEEGLTRLGFDPGPVDGTYDEGTGTAVAQWYRASTREPFGPTNEQIARIRELEQALSTATNENLAAEDAIAAALLLVDVAQANATNADKEVEVDVIAKTAAQERVFGDSASSAEEKASASTELDRAKTKAKAIELEGQLAIQDAVNAKKSAEREFEVTRTLATQLAADLAYAQAHVGVQIPLDELIFIPSLPLRIEQLHVDVGDAASGPLFIVTNNQLAIDSSLRLNEAVLVKPGMPVVIVEPDLGIEATGVVNRVATTPGTDGVDAYHVYFETLVDETTTSIEGFSLRLTVAIESTGGAVTTVPISALTLAADGTSRVQTELNGELKYLVVEPGLSASGFVEVTPFEGSLDPGQLVVVGFDIK